MTSDGPRPPLEASFRDGLGTGSPRDGPVCMADLRRERRSAHCGRVALALSPATVSFPIALTEGIVLAVGLIAILIVNLLLVRRSFAPLERLTRLMRSVDLLSPANVSRSPGHRRCGSSEPCSTRCSGGSSRSVTRARRDALKAQEAERKRVAQELHDEVGQALTAVMLQIGRLARRPQRPQRGAERSPGDDPCQPGGRTSDREATAPGSPR